MHDCNAPFEEKHREFKQRDDNTESQQDKKVLNELCKNTEGGEA